MSTPMRRWQAIRLCSAMLPAMNQLEQGGQKVWAVRARDRAGTQISLPSKWSKGGRHLSKPSDHCGRWLDHFAKTQITISLIAGHFPTEGGTVGREDGFPHGKARFEPW